MEPGLGQIHVKWFGEPIQNLGSIYMQIHIRFGNFKIVSPIQF